MTTATVPGEEQPILNPNPQLQRYYASLESRLGYQVLLGGTRHFGYWDTDTPFPFPISTSLRRMEEKFYHSLSLPAGSLVLDAGCGEAFVALYMASRGLRVIAIDVVQHHVDKAHQRITAAEKSMKIRRGAITANLMDFHHLEAIEDGSLDGVYAMETISHATDAALVIGNFYRLIRPGGRITINEYDHALDLDDERAMKDGKMRQLAQSMRDVNKYAAMPSNHISRPGRYKELLEQAGFEHVVVEDWSANVKPMMRLFYFVAVVPLFFVRLFSLEKYFVNTIAGAEMYRGYGMWRYINISARKPGPVKEPSKTK